jgi:hypothetical protein
MSWSKPGRHSDRHLPAAGNRSAEFRAPTADEFGKGLLPIHKTANIEVWMQEISFNGWIEWLIPNKKKLCHQ